MGVHEVWWQVPPVRCKGLCQESCGPAPALPAEPFHPTWDEATMTCTSLVDGRCSRYAERPLICRMWGAVPMMSCPWGCEPTMTDEEGVRVFLTMRDLTV